MVPLTGIIGMVVEDTYQVYAGRVGSTTLQNIRGYKDLDAHAAVYSIWSASLDACK